VMAYIRNALVKVKWPLMFFLWALHGVIALWQFMTGLAFEYSPPYNKFFSVGLDRF
jgi:hypothetical protein